MGHGWRWGAVAGLVVAGSGTARADMPLPPMPPSRTVVVTTSVDLGPVTDRVGERYVVRPRDTMRSVARLYASDPAAWKVISAANAATVPDPDRLRVGDVLWIPSKTRLAAARPASTKPAAADATEYAPFWIVTSGGKERLRHGRGAKAPEKLKGDAVTLCLVPAAAAADLLRLPDGTERASIPIAALPGAASATFPWPADQVPESDPTSRIEVQIRVRGVDGSRLAVDTDVLHYDGSGGVMARATPAPGADPAVPEAPARIPIAGIPDVRPSGSPFDPATEGEPEPDERFPSVTAILVALGGLLVLLVAWLARPRPPAAPGA